MSGFLAWLYGVSDRVYTLLWYLYSTILDVVLNAWAWSWDHARALVDQAITWVRDSFRNFEAWVLSSVNYAISYAINLYNDLVGWFGGVYEWVRSEIRSAWDGLIDYISSYAHSIYSQVMTWINQTRADVSAWVQGLINDWINRFQGLLPLLDRVPVLRDISEGGFFTKLAFIVNRGFDSLTAIIQNPLGMITGALWPVLTSMVCYVLAEGLGTEKYTLPPRPSWTGNGGGGPYDSPIPTDDVTLVAPVNPLYVSGYTYNPASGHLGTDYGLQDGQEVRACHSGRVEYAGWSEYGYGYMVIINGSGYRTLYAHLRTPAVAAGVNVSSGQVIGYGDSTGNSTGPHLHLELWVNGQRVNPRLWIG